MGQLTSFFALVAVSAATFLTVMVLSLDESYWTPTEDPSCILKIERTKTMFAKDTETITRYCEE